MKFACPKCNTRYSIADDKVPPGKVLKFPCKTCGNVVRLRRKEGDAANAQVLPGDLGAPATVSPTGDPVETTRIASVSELNKLRNQSTEPTRIGMPAAPEARAQAAKADAPVPLAEGGGETTRIVSVEQINILRAAAADDPTAVGGPGMNLAATPSPTPTPAATPQKQTSSEPSEWFVLIAGKQRGPMTASQVDGMLASNEIDKRTFVWKSGMGNWERISAVERFAGTGTNSSITVNPTAGTPTPAAGNRAIQAETLSFEESDFGRRLGDELEASDAAVVEDEDTTAQFAEKTQLVAQPATGEGSQQGVSAKPESEDGAGFYKAHTVVVQNPSGLQAALSSASPSDIASAYDPRPTDDKQPRATDTFHGKDPLEELNDPSSLGAFDDVSQNIVLPDEHSGMGALQDDPNYLQAPPGESTRVYMATAGIYKKRRNNRIAAVIATVVVLLIAGFIVMDQQGLIVLPGMGAVYDVAGVEDPNVDRALQRTEGKLSEEDLDPKKRAQLESLRRRLLDRSAETAQAKGGKKKADAPKVTGTTTADPTTDKEGVKENAATGTEEHNMAEQLFGDTRKQETGLTLAKPENIQTPNLPEGITPEAIYKVVADNNTSMKLCYAEASRKSEKLAGKMEVQMTIAPTGDVSAADITTPQFKNSTMGTCTVKRVKTWKFPRFNGDPVTVQFPYVLQQSF